MGDKYETVKLEYSIYKCSSYSGNCSPDNILVEDPTNQVSRWFTDTNQPDQYVMLKLKSPAIVESVTFGKYMKAHVSDLKKFQVLGGTDKDNLSVLLSAGLKNDNASEIFTLRHRTSEGFYLPILYIKIMPLQSWGPAYNFTIWYVAFHGKIHEDLIRSAMETIDLRKEEEAIRILLKHLRRRGYKDAFEALSRESGVQLEGPTQTRLWNALVEKGDFEEAERIFDQAVKEGELEWYMSWQPYTPRWRQISACSAQVEERLSGPPAPPPLPAAPLSPPSPPSPPPHDLACPDRDWNTCLNVEGGSSDGGDGAAGCSCKPDPRGGHQLVLDSTTSTLYLFGGWNGTEDLDDLWAYDIAGGRWVLLCAHSGRVGGPPPRSCHKMVFDPVHRKLFTLGRYLNKVQRQPKNMNSDMYVFDLTLGEWSRICEDTSLLGGPRLVFDHQMCIDPDTQTIYVFGGRVLSANSEEVSRPVYSGLYAYYIRTGTWQLLLSDQHERHAPQARVGHSMLFHPVRRRLYIFAGLRNKEVMLDLWWWDVRTGECGSPAPPAPPAQPSAAAPPPAAGFTQRATLDPDTDEMFVLSGMSKEKDKRVFNTLWVFSLSRLTWSCVYRNDRASPADPRPRFAHQLVYDPIRKIHYLFGGNPGTAWSSRLRLDDLWALELRRPATGAVAGRARAALREARYRQLAAAPARTPRALEYLRHDLHDALDHSDPLQVEHFHKLATVLFASPPAPANVSRRLTPQLTRQLGRSKAQAAQHAGGADLVRTLASVLGAEDSLPESPVPFEEPPEPEADPWDVADVAEERPPPPDAAWDARAARLQLYDTLCQYFPPSATPPAADLLRLVTM